MIGHFLYYFVSDDAGLESDIFLALKESIWLFHMPAFLFISGLFAKRLYTAERGLNVNTIAFYLVLYLLFYSLLFLIKPLSVFNPFTTSRVPWYLLVIAVLGASTAIIYRIRLGAKLVIPISIVISVVSGFYPDFDTFLSMGRMVNFAPFYFAGYYVSIQGLQEFILKLKGFRGFALVAIAILLVTCVIMCVLPSDYREALWMLSVGHYPYADCGNLPLALIVALRLLWFVVASALMLCVFILVPNNECFISSYGSKTLQVYILHALIYYALIVAGIPQAYIDLALPLSGVWVIVFSLALTWLLAVMNWPTRFFDWLKDDMSRTQQKKPLLHAYPRIRPTM